MTYPDLYGIRNIVFDFGRVLLNIDIPRSQRALAQLGFNPGVKARKENDDKAVVLYESGKITSSDFIRLIQSALRDPGTPEKKIIDAWNEMLLDFPENHILTLRKLKKKYRLFLLSNSNELHFVKYTNDFRIRYGFEMSTLFDKMWFSFIVGTVKPDPAIFEYIIKDGNLNPDETLFIDDTLMHVEAAKKIGIRSYHLEGETDVSDIFNL
jgi:putative hydrolase of the HAD superfamily